MGGAGNNLQNLDNSVGLYLESALPLGLHYTMNLAQTFFAMMFTTLFVSCYMTPFGIRNSTEP